jgi:hypothetical protein
LARTARPPPATGNPAEIRQANYQDLVSLPSVWREAGNDVVDKLAVDVVFSLITAIPLRDYGDKADPEFSKVAIYLHLGLSPSQRLFVLKDCLFSQRPKIRFAPDSPLEGFEPPVPLAKRAGLTGRRTGKCRRGEKGCLESGRLSHGGPRVRIPPAQSLRTTGSSARARRSRAPALTSDCRAAA